MKRTNGKDRDKKIISSAILLALAKDGRSLNQIATELNIESGGFCRIKQGQYLPSLRNFLKLKDWMQGLDIDLEKMIRAN